MSFFSTGPPSDADHDGYDDEGPIHKYFILNHTIETLIVMYI